MPVAAVLDGGGPQARCFAGIRGAEVASMATTASIERGR